VVVVALAFLAQAQVALQGLLEPERVVQVVLVDKLV
jgi:hypothetical protein